ncbi:MAG TPA: DUF3604 domain-containing protein, partial [Acidobacteria bacterium]|nr:DUF3604 domain-containing protein [Acidobacteriota bacterium]
EALRSECLDAPPAVPGGARCDVLAIPHNSNVSGGRMFTIARADGTPISADDAATRARLERLVEVTQHKGDSECRPGAADELCEYETLGFPRMMDMLGSVGDVPEVGFRRNVPTTATGYVEELWSRLRTRSVAGRLVSVFEQTYPATILSDLLVYPHGHDFPQVPLGRLDDPGGSGETATMWLRIASTDLPASTVRLITPPEGGTATAQYASHAVNLVLPGFDDARIDSAGGGYALEAAAQSFYQDFADQYQTLAFIPHRMPLVPLDTFNRTVWSDIDGIGMPLADDRAAFGGTALRALQVLPAGFLGHQATLLHQLAHHWGDQMHLGTLAGFVPAGNDPDRHTPLLYPDATLMGGVLYGTRQVARVVTGDGVERFEIARPTAPVRFHPLQLYRMGFLDPGEVPDITVFAEQAQFEPQRVSAPAVGTAVAGEREVVSMNTILAAFGTRDGPVFTEWNQAVVIISDSLLSQ